MNSQTAAVSPESIVAILGPGLLGGSICMALRQRMPQCEIRVWGRRQAAVDQVQRMRLADLASTSVSEVVNGATFIVLATPVPTMANLARQIASAEPAAGCVVTDVGSVKASVLAAVQFDRPGIQFVGSHPMAGSERAGIEAARADLFEGAVCILTPDERTDSHALARVRAFWLALGCHLMELPADQHDRHVARVSHMPHLMAAVTAIAALRADPKVAHCAGNGFRDTTRVAGGDPDLWTGIVLENAVEVRAALHDALDTLRELVAITDGMDEEALRRFLAEAQALRSHVSPAFPPYGHPQS